MREIIILSIIYLPILIVCIIIYLTIRIKNKRIKLLEEQIKKQKELIKLLEEL